MTSMTQDFKFLFNFLEIFLLLVTFELFITLSKHYTYYPKIIVIQLA